MKKIAALLLSGVVAATLLASCQQTPSSSQSAKDPSSSSAAPTGQKEVLEFYHGYYHDKETWAPAAAMRDIFDNFAKEYATGDVEFKAIPMENHNEVVEQQVSGGKFPDMVDRAGTALPLAAISQNLVYDLKPYIDSENLKDAVGINYTQNLVDGKIYSVHDQLLTLGYWYNEKVFTDAKATMPSDMKNWDDFSAAMSAVRKNGLYGFGSGQATNMLNAAFATTPEGAELLTHTQLTAEDVNSNIFINTFKIIAKIEQENGSGNVAGSEDVSVDFNTGKCALFVNGVWGAGSFAAVDNIRPAVYPGNVSISSAGAGITIANGMSEAKTKLALEFLKYMTSAEVQTRIFTEVGANPCNTTLDLSAIAKEVNDPIVTLLAEACAMANSAKSIAPSISTWGDDVVTVIDNKLKECGVASADIDAKAKELVSELTAILG